MRVRRGVVPAVFLFGCFHPDLDAARYACDGSLRGADCPPGFFCAVSTGPQGSVGLCQRTLSAPPGFDLSLSADLLPQKSDLRTVSDLRSVPDLAPTGPCTKTATAQAVAAGVFTCPGNFTAGNFATLCSAGYHVCGAADVSLKLVKAAECKAVSGFYATQIDAGITAGGTVADCPAAMAEPTALVGCGTETRTTAITPTAACLGQPEALRCEAAGTPWSCSHGLVDAAHQEVGLLGGVLCCID